MNGENTKSIVFGRVVIDLLHQFFGKSDPSAMVVTEVWANEEDDGEDATVACEHYRGHGKFKFRELRDPSRFYITDVIVNTQEDVLDQLKLEEDRFKGLSNSKDEEPCK